MACLRPLSLGRFDVILHSGTETTQAPFDVTKSFTERRATRIIQRVSGARFQVSARTTMFAESLQQRLKLSAHHGFAPLVTLIAPAALRFPLLEDDEPAARSVLDTVRFAIGVAANEAAQIAVDLRRH